jgi:vitamin B12 transporter
MKRKILIVAALTISSSIFSQTDSSFKTLEEVVFTVGKFPRKQSETGKVITVIDKKQLEQNSGRTIPEILNTVSGTTIIGANNTLGTNQTVSIRGSSAGNVLILLDGIPVYDPSALANYFDLNAIITEQVERIEILKGGQSTLYGSDAVAGVINIITQKTISKKQLITAGLHAGSYNTFKQNFGIAGNTKSLNYDLQLSNIQSKGFSSAYDSSDIKGYDKDGFDQQNISLRLTQKITDRLKAKFSGFYNTYNTDLDESAFTDDKDFTSKNINTQINTGLVYTTAKSIFNLNYQYNSNDRNYLNDSAFKGNPFFYYSKSKYKGGSHYAEIYGNRKFENAELLFGIDFRKNGTDQTYLSVSSFGPYKTTLDDSLANTTQVSPYASYVLQKNNFSLESGIRWNNHSAYGNNFTYTFNPYFILNKNSKVFTNIYSAFKTPTLYQLFDPFSGNKNLEAENSQIYEAGVHFSKKQFDTRIVGFYRNTKNAIQYVITNPAWFSGEFQNASRQINHGAEIESSYNFSKWNFKANYTFTKGEIRSSFDASGNKLDKDTTYNSLFRVPQHALNISAGYQLSEPVYLNINVRSVSKRLEPIYASSPKTLKGYYTINLYGEYKINKNFKAFFDLKNITDQKYFDVLGYNTRRFNFNTGVNCRL